MMTMRAPGCPMVKTIDDNIGLKGPDHSHYIGEYGIPVPYLQGFIGVFRIPKVIGPCKELLSSIYAPGSKQFLGAQDPE